MVDWIKALVMVLSMVAVDTTRYFWPNSETEQMVEKVIEAGVKMETGIDMSTIVPSEIIQK